MTRSVIINGKFLRAESTGVHRVATELADALADLVAEGHPAIAGWRFEVWHSKDGRLRANTLRLPTRCISVLEGIAWEQITLPAMQGNRLLLNLCNVGPVASGNAVTMIHDAQVHLSPRSYSLGFRLWYRLIQPILGWRARRILTVSAFSKREIEAAGICNASRIGVIHNGVAHVLRVSADDKIGPRLKLMKGRYVVALATTQIHKNIGILLESFASAQLANDLLVLVGSASALSFAEVGLSVPSNVIFAGRVSDSELRSLLENALCLAFPSTTEGFGLPPLEAMLLGCPALVAPCGALPEVCGEAAVYVPPHDAQAWVKAIEKVRDDRVYRAALVDAGRSHAATFTWRRAALTLLAQLPL